MKKIWVGSVVILIVLLLSFYLRCSSSTPLTASTEVTKEGLTVEVFPGVFDNGKDTVYIAIRTDNNDYKEVADFFAKKDAWQKMFPQKEIITMTDYTTGIIIHYTIKK